MLFDPTHKLLVFFFNPFPSFGQRIFNAFYRHLSGSFVGRSGTEVFGRNGRGSNETTVASEAFQSSTQIRSVFSFTFGQTTSGDFTRQVGFEVFQSFGHFQTTFDLFTYFFDLIHLFSTTQSIFSYISTGFSNTYINFRTHSCSFVRTFTVFQAYTTTEIFT